MSGLREDWEITGEIMATPGSEAGKPGDGDRPVFHISLPFSLSSQHTRFSNLVLVRKSLRGLPKHAVWVADKAAITLRAYNVWHYYQERDFIYVA